MSGHGQARPEGKGTFIRIDPYDHPSLWTQCKYSILWKIWPSMVAFTLIAVAVILIDYFVVAINLAIPSTMLTVLGTVLGFTISYRTSSAYERYIEGRKLWQQIQTATRLASRIIWMHVPNSTTIEELTGEKKALDAAKALLEKKTMLNLLEAYAVSVKHYLRGETGIHYEDLYHLVLFLPKYQFPGGTPIRRAELGNAPQPDSISRSAGPSLVNTPMYDEDKKLDTSDSAAIDRVRFRGTKSRANTQDTHASKDSTASSVKFGPRHPDKPLLPAHCPPSFNLIDDVFPVLAPIRSLFKFGRNQVVKLMDDGAPQRKKRKHKKDVYTGQNIPVEINLHISSWISALQRRKVVDVATINALLAPNASLAEALSGLERVLTTPIPFAYAVHLKHTAYIYLFFLPFQILGTLNWVTIPAQMVASFIFLGFLEISNQIEQPLGYDSADLDMGMFCDSIRKELRELSSMPPQDPADFFFCPLNEPLAPMDVRSTSDLVQDEVTVEDIQESLSKGHGEHTHGISRSFTEAQRSRSITQDHTAIVMQSLPQVKREDVPHDE